MIIRDELCCSVREKNEDYIWHDEKNAILLDGSTGLVKMELDSRWFVREFVKHFHACSEISYHLEEMIRDALERTESAFRKSIGKSSSLNPDKGGSFRINPSAAGCFLHEHNSTLQLCTIGDCTMRVFFHDGKSLTLHSVAVEELDGQVIKEATDLHLSTNRNVADIICDEEFQHMLIENRKKMNTPDGYQILSFGMDKLDPCDITVLDTNLVDRIVMFSDGFDLCAEALDDPCADLSSIYKTLREIENADPMCNRIPRLKKSDDAAALIISFE